MGIFINQQVKIFILFILCISLITCLYIKYNKYELFANEEFKNIPTNMKIFNDTEITNLTAKNAINNHITTLESVFNKYYNIEPSITITNNGLNCESWANYNTENSSPNDNSNTLLNNCKIVEGSESNEEQCLVDNVLSSCSTFFNDGYINSLSSIDINTFKNNIRDTIIKNSNTLNLDLQKKRNEIDILLNSLFDKLDLEKQQLYFIGYNKTNLNDKSNLVKRSEKEFEKDENDININQINFKNFLQKNNINDSSLNLYYKIIIGLIATIIIVGIFNLLVTEIL